MPGTYDVIVVRSEAIDLTCGAMAIWSPLRSIAGPSRSTWSPVAFIRSLEVATRCDVMNPTSDAMTIRKDEVTLTASLMVFMRCDQDVRESLALIGSLAASLRGAGLTIGRGRHA